MTDEDDDHDYYDNECDTYECHGYICELCGICHACEDRQMNAEDEYSDV